MITVAAVLPRIRFSTGRLDMTPDFDVPFGGDRPPPMSRVTLLATRDCDAQRELLILRAPAAAPRLPDATVAEAQTPIAAMRVLADTVLGAYTPSTERRITLVRERLPADRRVVLRASLLRTGPNHEATLMRFTLERGMRVRVTEVQEEFARVAYEEYSYADRQLAIATSRAGWLLLDALAAQVDHHLFHLHLAAENGHPADTRAVWIALDSATGLAPLHQRWLDRARPLLTC
jgi:hypothetical protein